MEQTKEQEEVQQDKSCIISPKEVNEMFIRAYSDLPEGITIEGHPLDWWIKHFTVKVNQSESDIYTLRQKLAQATDLLIECTDIYSRLKLSMTKFEFEEFYIFENTLLIESKIKKSLEAAKRAANQKSNKSSAAKKVSEMFIVVWEQQLWKLKATIKTLETLHMSVASEMKHMGRAGGFEDAA